MGNRNIQTGLAEVISHAGPLAGRPAQSRSSGKERDSETGLDYFGARYYGSTMGRFLTPDPLAGHTEDPQTLNRYSYVRNNPLTLTDPTGLDFYLGCEKQSDSCQKVSGNLVQGQYVNQNGQQVFQATVVTSASLQDTSSGNTATVNQNGVQITTANGTAQGVFISGTTAANGIQGSGALAGFSFNINDNCGGSCLASGSFQFSGTGSQARNLLTARGAWSYWGFDALDSGDFGFHPETDQFRFGSGPSSHFSVPWDMVMRPDYSQHMSGINTLEGDSGFVLRAVQNPKATVPVTGGFHVDKATGVGHAKDAVCSVLGC
jgi:RHS repeat-associated protein